MPNINVKVENKIATGDNSIIVCDNSDYIVNFTFDNEWDTYSTKTMRVEYDGAYQDVVFTGSSCELPIISNTIGITIGVYAGNLKTTTPVYFDCEQSILGENNQHKDPSPDIYNQLIDKINNVEKSTSSTLEKNNPVYVAEMIGVAKSYYDVRENNGQNTFAYGYRSALDSNFVSGDNTIDCSSFVGLVLRGITFEKSPYSILTQTHSETNETLTGEDDLIEDDSGATDSDVNVLGSISKNNKFDWSIDPYDYSNLKTNSSVNKAPIRTASQLAQWLFENNRAVDFKSDFSNVEVGDIIFYSKKDRSGNFTQPNRWRNISHVSIVANKFENDDVTLNYPYKHAMLEVTTIGKIVLNRTLEKVTPEYITMICRPPLGTIQPSRQIGNVNDVNINNIFDAGDYYLTSSTTDGLPLRYNNGIGLHLKVEKSITRYGKDYTLIQTLTDTRNNVSWKRTQYCYTNVERYVPSADTWTDWSIVSKFYDSRDLKNISSLSAIGQIVPVGCEMNMRVTDSNVLYGEMPVAQNGVLVVKHIYNSGNDDIILLRYILTGTTYEEYATTIYNSTVRAWAKII